MRNERFWCWFDSYVAPRLTGRDKTFREMFSYLDRFDRPVHIVETGCIEDPDNWHGNGCSTIQFDRYIDVRNDGSTFWSVDLIPAKVDLAVKHTINNGTVIICDDSVNFLRVTRKPIDLLYLDASHFDWDNPVPSQHHHLSELFAAMPALHAESMVAIDDSPAVMDTFPHADIGGKGGLVAKYLFSVGADLAFLHYQAGWTNPTAKPGRDGPNLEKLINSARAHVEGDRLVAASPIYNTILNITPPPWTPGTRIAHGEACAFFANLALMREKLGTAADWYRQALAADPRATDYRIELATKCYLAMGSYNAAQAEMKRATRIDPGHDRAWRVLGGIEHESCNAEASIAAFDKQLEICPDDPDAMMDRCTIALDTEDYELVKTLCDKVIGTRREADAWHMLGMVAHREGRHEEGIPLFDKAIEGHCFDTPLAHWHKSLVLGSIGRYREAWVEHAWRRDQKYNPGLSLPMKRFNAPFWNRSQPNRIEDRQAIVHVHGEAGAGDNLCLVRYLPQIKALGFKVRYEGLEKMDSLFARSFPDIEVAERALDYPGALGIREFDYHIPIGELPHAFNTSAEDAVADWRGPYLKADQKMVEQYRRLLPIKRRKIGVCWSSGIREYNLWLRSYGQHKGMRFEMLRPLLSQWDDCFVSLQIGPEREEQRDSAMIADILPKNPTWDDTAALIENLDLVLTVDTAVAHLAGAMGKPVWLMMHAQGSWHWMVERPGSVWNTKSPWYPSVRIFRSGELGNWSGVIADMCNALAKPKLEAAE